MRGGASGHGGWQTGDWTGGWWSDAHAYSPALQQASAFSAAVVTHFGGHTDEVSGWLPMVTGDANTDAHAKDMYLVVPYGLVVPYPCGPSECSMTHPNFASSAICESCFVAVLPPAVTGGRTSWSWCGSSKLVGGKGPSRLAGARDQQFRNFQLTGMPN